MFLAIQQTRGEMLKNNSLQRNGFESDVRSHSLDLK